ncbi:hypothetical protein ACKKBF_B37005 [Auxenochlorella protothecoides x Auxenochlorella symbiontica]
MMEVEPQIPPTSGELEVASEPQDLSRTKFPDAVEVSEMDTDALEESEGATGSTTNSLGGTRHADALAVPAVERGPRRLWLVRVPKPPEVTALAALEQELAAYTQQVKLLNESASVKKVARDDARKDTQAAREAYRLCRDAYNACMEVVTPLREAARGSAGAGPRRLRESYPELEVWSVAELDERLAGMEYRLQHESVPLAEEKRLVAGLKRLADQRARVAEYEAAAGAARDPALLADAARARAALAEAEEEARALREERAAQKEVLDGFWEAERAVDAEVEAILAERRRLKELQDEAYARVSEVRRAHRERKDAYYSSRRHSTGVRALLREPGGVEKARAMCGEQVDRQLAVLRDNDDYRAEYLTLIEQQRGRPSTWEEGEEAGNGARRGHSRQPSLPLTEEETKERAQGTIAAVLEQARSRVVDLKHAAAAATAAAAPHPVAVEVAVPVAPAEPRAMPKKAPRAEPAHPEPERAAPEPEPAFELPAAVAARARCETAAAEADRAAEAERQRAARAEAEKKKARRAEKAKRGAERARAAAAAAETSAAAAAATVASAAAAAAAPAPALAEEGAAAGGEGGVTYEAAQGATAVAGEAEAGPGAAEAPAPAPAAPAGARRKANPAILATNAPLSVAKAMVAKPAARRPAAARKSLVKTLRSFYRENEMAMVLALIGLIVAAVAYMSLTAA